MPKISENSYISIGLLVLSISTVVGILMWLNSEFKNFEKEIGDLNQEIALLKGDSERKWSKLDMGTWALTFKNLNPSIDVPGTYLNIQVFSRGESNNGSFKFDTNSILKKNNFKINISEDK